MNTTPKPTYTPGKWRVQECHEDGIFNLSYYVEATDPSDPDGAIVICRLPTGLGAFSNQLPNAQIIAAAPDLLNALELAEATIKRLERYAPGSANGTLDVVRAAIARATEK